MRVGLFYTLFLILSSCTDTPVEISASTFSSFSTLDIVSSGLISKNQSVTFSMTTAYRDGQVSRIAIYNEGTCSSDATKVSEIANQVSATSVSTILPEGKHTFFYRPVYTNPVASLSALCLPTGLNYTVDRTVPGALGISRTTTSPTVDRNVGVNVTGCEISETGASSLLFTESSNPVPIGSEPGWESCASTKIFTVSAVQATKNIYAFAKDIAGNISVVSAGFSVTLSSSPNISTTATTYIFYIDTAIAPIVFTNTGGPIASCTPDVTLPLGLAIDPNTCQISGTPTATQSQINYQISASGAGATSIVTISIEVRPRPIAIVSFNSLGAGPGITTPTASGGQTYNTLLSAMVSGTDVTSYKYYLDTNGVVNCATHNSYSAEFANGVSIAADLASFEGNKRLCVLGRNAAGIWQIVPTVVDWVQAPRLQNLSTDFLGPRNITIDNQPASTTVITRSFQFGTPIGAMACDTCLISKNGGPFQPTQAGMSSADIVRFQFSAGFAGSTTSAIISTLGTTFNLNIRATPASCGVSVNRRQIFLTRNTISGNMGGLAGADSFCNQEATADAVILPKTGWKALLSGSGLNGFTLLTAANNYCDSNTNHPIISSFPHSFQNPFYRFRDNTLVNGGDSTEWKFIAGAPRNITSTQFWFGKNTECNCSNWTTDSTTSVCTGAAGSANGGRLSFDSAAPQPMSSLPDSGIIGGCSQKHHLICVQQ